MSTVCQGVWHMLFQNDAHESLGSAGTTEAGIIEIILKGNQVCVLKWIQDHVVCKSEDPGGEGGMEEERVGGCATHLHSWALGIRLLNGI